MLAPSRTLRVLLWDSVRAVQGIQFCGREQSRIFRRREVGLQAAEQLEKMTKPTDDFRPYKKK